MTSAARDWVDYPHGTVATVESRLAVMVRPGNDKRGRWDWMDGTWTTIPITEPVVVGNIYALPLVDALKQTIDDHTSNGRIYGCNIDGPTAACDCIIRAYAALEAALRGEGQ